MLSLRLLRVELSLSEEEDPEDYQWINDPGWESDFDDDDD